MIPSFGGFTNHSESISSSPFESRYKTPPANFTSTVKPFVLVTVFNPDFLNSSLIGFDYLGTKTVLIILPDSLKMRNVILLTLGFCNNVGYSN